MNKLTSNHQFSDELVQMLTESGWYIGRNIEKSLRLPTDFVIFSTAKLVLEEYGNLICGTRGAGIDRARSTLNLNPTLATGESDRFELYEKQIGARLYPLGEGDDGHYFVAIDEIGRVFLLMDFIKFAGDDFESALANLLLGKKSQPADEREWKCKGVGII